MTFIIDPYLYNANSNWYNARYSFLHDDQPSTDFRTYVRNYAPSLFENKLKTNLMAYR